MLSLSWVCEPLPLVKIRCSGKATRLFHFPTIENQRVKDEGWIEDRHGRQKTFRYFPHLFKKETILLQPRAYNKNKSGALLFLSPRCKLQHSPHSLFPPTQHYREGESVHCDGICILGSKIIVHQIWIGSTLLAVALSVLLLSAHTHTFEMCYFLGPKLLAHSSCCHSLLMKVLSHLC